MPRGEVAAEVRGQRTEARWQVMKSEDGEERETTDVRRTEVRGGRSEV